MRCLFVFFFALKTCAFVFSFRAYDFKYAARSIFSPATVAVAVVSVVVSGADDCNLNGVAQRASFIGNFCCDVGNLRVDTLIFLLC